ncbi:MAG: HAD family hydrolase [Clostridia bacterium]|nr:HAD family hydrolase [Clostridia bacterium]
MIKYIFDLDNTLVYTDELNNEAYNYALKVLNKDTIDIDSRITREIVFLKIKLNEDEKKTILKIKQEYFIENIKKLKLNEQLISFLKSQNPEDCILWTKADKNRVEAILNYFDLKKYFIWIFYSDKTNIINDINFMTKKLCCSKCDLIIFDDIKY